MSALLLLLLWRNSRLRQRANQQFNAQNTQLKTQRDELRAALVRLEEAQVQLVESEKMAFPGELTAGIAHELQNPLAFVKNLADVSALLVDDIRGEPSPAANGDGGQELLLAGLKRNLREISQHGQRATSIIVSMLAPITVNSCENEFTWCRFQVAVWPLARSRDAKCCVSTAVHEPGNRSSSPFACRCRLLSRVSA